MLASVSSPQRCPVNTDRTAQYIAAAVAARAELIVTGDRKHLPPIGCHQDIAIVTAREIFERLAATGKA
jgi:predicted nucleic acid-binding protein